jgi:hypothetical protein
MDTRIIVAIATRPAAMLTGPKPMSAISTPKKLAPQMRPRNASINQSRRVGDAGSIFVFVIGENYHKQNMGNKDYIESVK